MSGLQKALNLFSQERPSDLGVYFPLLSLQDHFVNISKSGGSLVSNMICRGGLIVQAVVCIAATCFRMLTTVFSLFFSNVRDQALNFSVTAMHVAAVPTFFMAAFLSNQEMEAISLSIRGLQESSDKEDKILEADKKSFDKNYPLLAKDVANLMEEIVEKLN